MIFIKRLFLLLILLFSCSCATKPIATELATMPAEQRIFNDKYFSKNQGNAAIIIKRDKGFNGWACWATISINGEPIAKLKQSEKITLYLPEGEYILSACLEMCGGNMSELLFIVKNNEDQVYRVGITQSFDLILNRTAF